MKRALVIQHVDMEGPARIADLCREREIAVEVRKVFAGDEVPRRVDENQILVVMGGGMGVAEKDDPRYPFLRPEIELLRGALADGRAILGVCLGAQLLASAAGARVYPNLRAGVDGHESHLREVGWGKVALHGREREPALAGLGAEALVLHWHGDTFDLPPGAVNLASSPACAQQAFRIGARVFGLQFHVECDADVARRWVREDADFVHAARGADGQALVLAETERHAAAARAAGDRLLGNILGCMIA